MSLKQTIPRTLKSSTTPRFYKEHRNACPPSATLGDVGDIYLDTSAPALYGRYEDGWRPWPGPRGRLEHPIYGGEYVLWPSPGNARVFWATGAQTKKLLGSASEILGQIISSLKRQDSKKARNVSGPNDTLSSGSTTPLAKPIEPVQNKLAVPSVRSSSQLITPAAPQNSGLALDASALEESTASKPTPAVSSGPTALSTRPAGVSSAPPVPTNPPAVSASRPNGTPANRPASDDMRRRTSGPTLPDSGPTPAASENLVITGSQFSPALSPQTKPAVRPEPQTSLPISVMTSAPSPRELAPSQHSESASAPPPPIKRHSPAPSLQNKPAESLKDPTSRPISSAQSASPPRELTPSQNSQSASTSQLPVKRVAPSSSETGPRKRPRKSADDRYYEAVAMMLPVQKQLKFLENAPSNSDDERDALLAIGRHLEKVVTEKASAGEVDTVSWKNRLWRYASLYWPHKFAITSGGGSELEGIYRQMLAGAVPQQLRAPEGVMAIGPWDSPESKIVADMRSSGPSRLRIPGDSPLAGLQNAAPASVLPPRNVPQVAPTEPRPGPPSLPQASDTLPAALDKAVPISAQEIALQSATNEVSESTIDSCPPRSLSSVPPPSLLSSVAFPSYFSSKAFADLVSTMKRNTATFRALAALHAASAASSTSAPPSTDTLSRGVPRSETSSPPSSPARPRNSLSPTVAPPSRRPLPAPVSGATATIAELRRKYEEYESRIKTRRPQMDDGWKEEWETAADLIEALTRENDALRAEKGLSEGESSTGLVNLESRVETHAASGGDGDLEMPDRSAAGPVSTESGLETQLANGEVTEDEAPARDVDFVQSSDLIQSQDVGPVSTDSGLETQQANGEVTEDEAPARDVDFVQSSDLIQSQDVIEKVGTVFRAVGANSPSSFPQVRVKQENVSMNFEFPPPFAQNGGMIPGGADVIDLTLEESDDEGASIPVPIPHTSATLSPIAPAVVVAVSDHLDKATLVVPGPELEMLDEDDAGLPMDTDGSLTVALPPLPDEDESEAMELDADGLNAPSSITSAIPLEPLAAPSATGSSLVVPSAAPGHFRIDDADWDFTDERLKTIVLQNNGQADLSDKNWGGILAELQLLAERFSTKPFSIERHQATTKALKEYYQRFLAPPGLAQPNMASESVSSEIVPSVEPVVGGGEELFQDRDLEMVSEPLFEVALPIEPLIKEGAESLLMAPACCAGSQMPETGEPGDVPDEPMDDDPRLIDPRECKGTPSEPKVKIEEDFNPGLRSPRFSRKHMELVFQFRDGFRVCDLCVMEESVEFFKCPSRSSLEVLSDHVKEKHREIFDIIIEQTQGMDEPQISKWWLELGSLSQDSEELV